VPWSFRPRWCCPSSYTATRDEELTHIGPGTPCGEYFRRYWQPICFADELQDIPLRARILGEEIDWVAPTYYRCERVVQDLIECAGQVWFRDDLSEASKAAAVQLFSDIFAEGGEVDAAFAAAARLQTGLSFHNIEGA
jgi:hypothetical protein